MARKSDSSTVESPIPAVFERVEPPRAKPRGGPGPGRTTHPIHERLGEIKDTLMRDPGGWYKIGQNDTSHSTYYNALVNDSAVTDPDTGITYVFYEVKAVPVGTTGEVLTDKDGNVKYDKDGHPRERVLYDILACYVGEDGQPKRRQRDINGNLVDRNARMNGHSESDE